MMVLVDFFPPNFHVWIHSQNPFFHCYQSVLFFKGIRHQDQAAMFKSTCKINIGSKFQPKKGP